MVNRIAIGAIIVIFLTAGVYFAHLSRESDRALRATKESALSSGTALDRERKERERFQEELKRRNADLEKERAALAQLREASAGYEGKILTLHEKIADMDASLKAAVQTSEGREAALEEVRKKMTENAADVAAVDRKRAEQLSALQGKVEKSQLALRREREAKAGLEKKLQAQEAALAEERKKAARLTKSLSGFESDVSKLQKAVAGKSEAAAEFSRKLVATKTSLSKLDEQHRAAKAQAMRESQRAQKLRASLEALKKQISGKDLTLKETKDMLRIDIVGRLLFDVGSAEIREEGREALDKLAGYFMEQKGKVIRIEGHTDNQPIRGALARRYPTNWELSSARAISVVRYLQSKGVPPERLSATGYSYYRGESSNETPKGRARNRRIAILMSRVKRIP